MIQKLNPPVIKKGQLLYEGKGKKIFEVLDQPEHVILFFKDDLTAYQGKKKGHFKAKGEICQTVSTLIFKHLSQKGVPTHFIQNLNSREVLCFKTQILPLEVVIRNRLAGSTAKRLGLPEGEKLKSPLLEFYYKKDELDDPFISEEQIYALNLISDSQLLEPIKTQAQKINKILESFFLKVGLELVDFKMEFGLFKDKLLLADEISPDSCRIWDQKSRERLDKDRFRRAWGKVEESYQQIADRLLAKYS